jgi:hypothetical protein
MAENPDRYGGEMSQEQNQVEIEGQTTQEQAEVRPVDGGEVNNTSSAGVPKEAGEAAQLVEKMRERQTKQEFYWKRQAEKLSQEIQEERKAKAAELGQLRTEREEALAKLGAAQDKTARLEAIAQAGLPAELAQLVPEADKDQVAEYVEKLKPLADKLRRGGVAGTLTNPARSASGDAARLSQLAAAAKRGDKHALREYAHLRESAGAGK